MDIIFPLFKSICGYLDRIQLLCVYVLFHIYIYVLYILIWNMYIYKDWYLG